MGKAPVDLPDPLEQPSPAPSAGADDLLSQLAGDEIDRLLAEAERSPGGPEMRRQETPEVESSDDEAPLNETVETDLITDSPSLAAVPAAEAVMDEIAETAADVSNQLDQLFAQLDDKPHASEKPNDHAEAVISDVGAKDVQAASVIDERELSAEELDRAIAQAAPSVVEPDETAGAAESVPALAEVTEPIDAPPAPIEQAIGSAESVRETRTPTELAAAVPTREESETSPAERSLLDTANHDSPDDASDNAAADLLKTDDLPAPVPIYLKPLVWLNAPFAALSEGTRESLGKVAVVTLMNALAVLLYVLIFRAS